MSDILKSWITDLRKVPKKQSDTGSPTEFSSGSSNGKTGSASSAEPQENVETLSLEVGDEMRLLLSPEYIQIDSPQRLEEALRGPFFSGSKNVILINPQNGKITSAALLKIQPEYLWADIATPTELYKRGDQMLVVFPILPKRQFVLQTVVDAIDRDTVKLLYQDPRYEERSSLQFSGEISLHYLSAEAITAILKRQVQIKREIVLSRDPTPATQKVQVADLLHDLCSARLSTHMQCFDAPPHFVCGLDNISLGGACLTLKGTHDQDEFLNHVIRLHFPVLPIKIGSTAVQLLLQPLAVVRNVRIKEELSYLHVQFLRRLPNELLAFFEGISS